MCAITGLFSLNSQLPPRLILEMTQILKHRGPDDEGFLAITRSKGEIYPLRGPDSSVDTEPLCETFSEDALGFFGHRRLSILDLSNAGRQPMPYRDHLWITHNGEIYNYLELREELSKEGYSFQSETDTEVILAAYDHWGEDCVTRFNGDWAFCILDKKQNKLFLSRDRYGVKPLFYFHNDSHFAFSSEMKGLLTLPFVEKKLDPEMVSNAMLFSLVDHNDQTLYSTISQLPPGHNLIFDLQSGKFQKSSYYKLPSSEGLGHYNESQAKKYVADIRELLFDSVRIRLRADVPIGSCLSGGLDSSAIVAIMARLIQKEGKSDIQHTFTASFPGEAIDESQHARNVLESVNAQGHFVFPKKETYMEDLSQLFHHQEGPLVPGGTSDFSHREVMKEARKFVKVTLDGQAADEVFSGYRNNRASFFADLFTSGRLFTFLQEISALMLTWKSPSLFLKEIKSLPFFILEKKFKKRAYRLIYRKDFAKFKSLYGYENKTGIHCVSKMFSNNINEMLEFFMTTGSLPHLLKYMERNSMGFSLEARMPFTDYRLVDYVFPIPAVYKTHNGWTKWLLRLAVEDLLPKEVVWRKDKLGFTAPTWLSKWELLKIWLESNQLEL